MVKNLKATMPSLCEEYWELELSLKLAYDFFLKHGQFGRKTWSKDLPEGAVPSKSLAAHFKEKQKS